jgi:hypothetical protein
MAKVAVARFDVALQDVSVASADGVILRGWFAHPLNANGNAVILLHGFVTFTISWYLCHTPRTSRTTHRPDTLTSESNVQRSVQL